MINPTDLTPIDLNSRVIYRPIGGAPSYATLINWNARILCIVIDGDTATTVAEPAEVALIPRTTT